MHAFTHKKLIDLVIMVTKYNVSWWQDDKWLKYSFFSFMALEGATKIKNDWKHVTHIEIHMANFIVRYLCRRLEYEYQISCLHQ